ncbi:MAG TPA: hypothetical protein VLU92_06240 [Candidatus Dormibacteraeota bacterium]|nr:hypothetical protein [Candidatus Dormibacteraeota bacterium]
MRRIAFAALIVTGLVQALFWTFVALVYFVLRGFSLGPVRAEVVT